MSSESAIRRNLLEAVWDGHIDCGHAEEIDKAIGDAQAFALHDEVLLRTGVDLLAYSDEEASMGEDLRARRYPASS